MQGKLSSTSPTQQESPSFTQKRGSKAVAAAFGIWRDRPIDGLEYERQLRDEWERGARPARRRARRRR